MLITEQILLRITNIKIHDAIDKSVNPLDFCQGQLMPATFYSASTKWLGYFKSKQENIV